MVWRWVALGMKGREYVEFGALQAAFVLALAIACIFMFYSTLAGFSRGNVLVRLPPMTPQTCLPCTQERHASLSFGSPVSPPALCSILLNSSELVALAAHDHSGRCRPTSWDRHYTAHIMTGPTSFSTGRHIIPCIRHLLKSSVFTKS